MPAIPSGAISYPPQQHLNTIHFALAIVILLLTVYPYLFNSNQVAAFSASELELTHKSIDTFDIIQTDDIAWSKSRITRDTKEQLLHAQSKSPPLTNELLNAIHNDDDNPRKKVQFLSLGKKFKLVLDRKSSSDYNLISKGFTVVALDREGRETLVPFDRDDIQILDGFVEGETKSAVTASFNRQDNLMTAQIKTGNDIVLVEPTYLHRDQLTSISETFRNTTTHSPLPDITNSTLPDQFYNGSMIVYRLRDHIHTKAGNSTLDLDSLCGAVKLDQTTSTNKTSALTHEDNEKNPHKEQHIEKTRTRRSIETVDGKDKTRCTLHLVADYLFYKSVGNGDIQTTINYLLALVNRVNLIYLPTVWDTGDGGDTFKGIGFTVQNITIHQEYTRTSVNSDIHYNMAIDYRWKAREFLDNFSKNAPPRHYCLAHLFTYRQFDTPVLGLAYVASPRLGTIGGICSQVQQKDESLYKHNTGISTSKGISGETLITRQTDLVVAHEFGHNFGAEHDTNECRPAPSRGGAFLMHPFAVMGFEKNNRFLSNCSRSSIGRVLSRKAATCFVQVADHVCGNGIVEDNEDCDGGNLGFGHRDPCCDSSCHFTPGSQCSDRHSWCCNKCRIQYAGFPCRPAEELNCKQSSYCDGRSAECPPSPPIEDNKTCLGGGFCRSGECRPFCEAHDLMSCMCDTPANACKLCCKATINGTCTPYNPSAPHLPDGNQCYRGICEKGRCEQPIQDVVERLWDVIEDITLTTFAKFLRDNIILVVLVCSIPIWCLFSYYINEFDKRFKQNFMNAVMRQRRKGPASQSPFLPRLFVSDDLVDTFPSDSPSKEDPMSRQPLRPQPRKQHPFNGGQGDQPPRNNNGAQHHQSTVMAPPHQPGFIHRPTYGFRVPHGDYGPGNSIAMNSIELPHQQQQQQDDSNNTSNEEDPTQLGNDNYYPPRISDNSYSTQV